METLQGEIDHSAHPTRAYPSFSCKKELGVLLPPPKDRISVFYRVMPWLFVKFLWQFAKSTYQHFGVERDTL